MTAASIDTAELRESIRSVLAAESDSSLARAERTASAPARSVLWRKVSELGWLGLGIPEAYGGLGLGPRHLACLYEELGRHLAAVPVMSTLLAADAIVAAGSELQRRRWLPLFAAGERCATLALPTAAIELPRLIDGVLEGSARDVLHADEADEILLPVQDQSGDLRLAVVERAAAGVRIDERPLIDRSRALADVTLDGIKPTPERLLPWNAAHWTRLLDHASLAIACDAAGGAMRILANTIAYLGERRQFDRPIGSFQALKHRAASWKIRVEGVAALTRHAAELLAQNDPTRSGIASAAKASATETYVGVAGDAIQLHGGIGFTWEHDCHLFLKRATLDAALFGGILQHKDRAAQSAFGTALGPRRMQGEPLAVRHFFAEPLEERSA